VAARRGVLARGWHHGRGRAGKLLFHQPGDEQARATKTRITNFDRVYTRDDMVADVILPTGVTDGSLLHGIKREPGF
jgi:fructose-1,6-bisphosphatase II / sedoheptulose-1,7-bisphosphatase